MESERIMLVIMAKTPILWTKKDNVFEFLGGRLVRIRNEKPIYFFDDDIEFWGKALARYEDKILCKYIDGYVEKCEWLPKEKVKAL